MLGSVQLAPGSIGQEAYARDPAISAMVSDRDTLAVTADLEVETTQAVLRDAVGIGALLLVVGMVSFLPGAGRTIPGTTLTLGAVVSTFVWVAIVAAILLATPTVGMLVSAAVEGPRDVVADLEGAARYALVFVAIVVAYDGWGAVAVPLLAPAGTWMYDVAFLGFALVPVVAIGRRLYRNADPIAAGLATALVGSAGDAGGTWEPSEPR